MLLGIYASGASRAVDGDPRVLPQIPEGMGLLTNRSHFDLFTTLVGSAPKIEGVRVQIAYQ
jgi:hypothetical protein